MRKPTKEKQRYWADLLKSAEGSGMSLAEFAKTKGVPAQKLYQWRSTLRGKRPANTHYASKGTCGNTGVHLKKVDTYARPNKRPTLRQASLSKASKDPTHLSQRTQFKYCFRVSGRHTLCRQHRAGTRDEREPGAQVDPSFPQKSPTPTMVPMTPPIVQQSVADQGHIELRFSGTTVRLCGGVEERQIRTVLRVLQ